MRGGFERHVSMVALFMDPVPMSAAQGLGCLDIEQRVEMVGKRGISESGSVIGTRTKEGGKRS